VQYFENKDIKDLTSLKIGGIVKKFYIIETEVELKNLLASLPIKEKNKIRLLGSGTNILVKDDKVLDLIVLKLKGDFEKITINDEDKRAGSAVLLNTLIKLFLDKCYQGMEILAGIPGTLGGAVFGNAGTKYGDISKFIKTVRIMDYTGKINAISVKNIGFEYRNMIALDNNIILDVEFQNSSFEFINTDDAKQKILDKFNCILKEKVDSQPYNLKTAGCVFKNLKINELLSDKPTYYSAGKIIDDLGLKNTKIRSVSISSKHANFFIAEKDAKFKDFVDLIELVKDKVKESKNFDLELEIKIWE
jgi:UDP-N-acetylmuramate dehydrogenase